MTRLPAVAVDGGDRVSFLDQPGDHGGGNGLSHGTQVETVGQFDQFRVPLLPEAGHGQVECRICTHDDRREGWQLVLLAEPDQQRFRVALLVSEDLGSGGGRTRRFLGASQLRWSAERMRTQGFSSFPFGWRRLGWRAKFHVRPGNEPPRDPQAAGVVFSELSLGPGIRF